MANSSSAMACTLSVIIPTFNGEDHLRELLASLTIQTRVPDEILVIDSQSTDNCVEVARSYGARVTVIDRNTFDHGATRSLAAQMATGDLLVYFTQDVILAHREVLALLIQPLKEDGTVAVSYGRQLPAFDAGRIAAHLREFNYPDVSTVRTYSDRHGLGLETVFNSNSCAAYVKKHLAGIKFFKSGLIFGEDTLAAGRLLERGKKIAYVAEATVYHSHNYGWHEEFSRYFDIGVFHRDEAWLLSTFGHTGGRGKKYVRSGISYLYNHRCYGLIGDFVVRVSLKFIGYQLGRHYRFLPRRFVAKLSMNKTYWEAVTGF